MDIFLIASVICIIIGFLVWRYYKDIQLLETVTPRNRGERSERKTVLKLLKMGIDHRAIFHDCYIRKASGHYTQVDLVVATRAGLIVFEIKDYSGWIYGHYRQREWTKVLAYGKEKHYFYNPFMQNHGHIQAIRKNLHHNSCIPIYSIIVFFGNSVLKGVTYGADNEYLIYPKQIKRIVKRILSNPDANYGDKSEIMDILTEAVLNGCNSEIVSSQIRTAQQAGRNRKKSHYVFTLSPSTLFKRYIRHSCRRVIRRFSHRFIPF